jgi:hypothetical protein
MNGLHVDHDSVNRVKALLKQGSKVVLLPLYKAQIDPYLMVYLHNHF